VHAHRHGADVVGDARLGGGFPGIVLGEGGGGADDVGENVAGQELAVLQHHPQLAPQGRQVDAGHVLPVIVDCAARRRFEPQQQAQQGGLAGTGGPDQRDEFTRTDMQGNLLEDRRAIRGVAETQAADFDLAAQGAGMHLAFAHFRQCLQDGLGTLVNGNNTEHRGKHARGRQHGAHEAAECRAECQKCTRCESCGKYRILGEPCHGVHGEQGEDVEKNGHVCHRGVHRVENTHDVARHRCLDLVPLLAGVFIRPVEEGPAFRASGAQLGDAAEQLKDQPGNASFDFGQFSFVAQTQIAGDHGEQDGHNNQRDSQQRQFHAVIKQQEQVEHRKHGRQQRKQDISRQCAADGVDAIGAHRQITG